MLDLEPTHVADYCYRDYSDRIFLRLLDVYDGLYTTINIIKCSCGNNRFVVYIDPNPTVEIVCKCCLKRISVYDLAYYPAAVKCPKDNDVFSIVHLDSQSEFKVYAIYEYSDDYDGENDVSWCHVYISTDDDLIEIVNDETS